MFNCKIKTDKVSLWRFNSEDLLFHNKQVYVSEEESVRAELFKLHYNDVLVRYFSVERTLKLLTQKYYWIDMHTDVKEYVASCDICQRVKVSQYYLYSEMQVLSQLKELWREVTMNFITDLLFSKYNRCIYNVILVIVHQYIKMICYIYIIKIITVTQLTDIFYEKIVCWYEVSKEAVSDWESVFTSAFWSEVMLSSINEVKT